DSSKIRRVIDFPATVEAHAGSAVVGPTKLRMVESVKGLRAKFQSHPLSNAELFEQRHCRVICGWLACAGDCPGSVTDRKVLRLTEDVLCVCKVVIDEIQAAIPLQDSVEVGTTLIRRVGWYLLAAAECYMQRSTAGITVSPIDLPPAKNAVQHRIHAASELATPAKRQIVDITELQNLRRIPCRHRSLQIRPVRVLQTGCAAKPGDAVVGGGSIVDRLGPCVGRQKLQTVGIRLLRAELQGMIDRARIWRRIAGQGVELRKGPKHLVTRNRISRERAVGVGDDSEEGVRQIRVAEIASLTGCELVHKRT